MKQMPPIKKSVAQQNPEAASTELPNEAQAKLEAKGPPASMKEAVMSAVGKSQPQPNEPPPKSMKEAVRRGASKGKKKQPPQKQKNQTS